MELKYYYSESTVKPQEIEAGKTTVYFRKDITSEERPINDKITQTFYIYQEAKMPLEDFKKMAEVQVSINALKAKNDSLINNDNQLAIMEAIADLYSLVLGGGSV